MATILGHSNSESSAPAKMLRKLANSEGEGVGSIVGTEQNLPIRERRTGIRRVARACSRSLSHWNDTLPPTNERTKIESRLVSLSSSYEMSFRKLELLEKRHREEEDRHEAKTTHKSTATCQMSDYASVPRPFKTLRKSQPSIENMIVPSAVKNSASTSASLRVLVIRNLLSQTGLNSVLSQVHGGPLERVVYHQNRIELYFVFPEQAKRFFLYGTQTGLFVVNGSALRLEWASSSNAENLDAHHPAVQKNVLQEIVQSGSRRSLIFAQAVEGKPIRNDKKLFYPDPSTHFSLGLDIAKIKQDFSTFGQVQCILPVISRKLCFSLSYADVRLAIIAKRECETSGTFMHGLYGKWTVWYGKDCTDRPCILLY